jgi:hypothetical protein
MSNEKILTEKSYASLSRLLDSESGRAILKHQGANTEDGLVVLKEADYHLLLAAANLSKNPDYLSDLLEKNRRFQEGERSCYFDFEDFLEENTHTL